MEEELPESLAEIFKRPITISRDLIESKSVAKRIKEYNELSQYHVDEDKDIDLCELLIENEQNAMAQKVFEDKALFKQDGITDYTGGKKETKKVKTTGKGWFNMKQPEMTDELMMDLKTIKMRNLIYKKRFYKGNDTNKLPTFFQVGEVVLNGNEMRDEKLTKKERKSKIAEMFLDDDGHQGLTDKKFVEITDKRRRMGIKKRYLKNVTKYKKRSVKA
eukprot:CAMPEP_0168342832 /NCGR_PEP_ID=MMETSP0213-20121227/15654_1 /TAXON_ID=151035 /ORGANISM="Euplotes harpa, Strain FSP1.4" /LENGTH=217 /DNA_ID=CAMNT_0008349855 /DNA_START=1 /DNA_END=654 /DNA_ORIENTATION=+